MKDYKKELMEQVRMLDVLIKKAEKRLKANSDFAEVIVYGHKKGNGHQYYVKKQDGTKEYIRKSEIETARKSIQHEYDKRVLNNMIVQRKRLLTFINGYDLSTVENTYSDLSVSRKIMVDPIVETEVTYTKNWLENHTGEMNPFPEETLYLTEKGEKVRSKSEKILADLFYKMKIPYCYEARLELKNLKTIYPDFTLLRKIDRKTVYWEHFGLADDGEYASKALKRCALYEADGYVLGKDFLFSVESRSIPLNIKNIEKKIKEFFMI